MDRAFDPQTIAIADAMPATSCHVDPGSGKPYA